MRDAWRCDTLDVQRLSVLEEEKPSALHDKFRADGGGGVLMLGELRVGDNGYETIVLRCARWLGGAFTQVAMLAVAVDWS